MYDQSQGDALNYGNVGGQKNKRRSAYSDWRNREGDLQDSFTEDAPLPAPTPVNPVRSRSNPSPLSNAIQQQRPMGQLYNSSEQDTGGGEEERSPLAPTGIQKRFFNSSGRDNYASKSTDPNSLPQWMQDERNKPSQAIDPNAPKNSALSNAITKQGWGFDSRDGGAADFDYTPMGMGDTSQFEGFNFDNRTERDLGSMKYVFAQAASNVDVTQPDSLSKVVANLNTMGIPAKLVPPDHIDFGLGEGPIDVIRGGNPEGGIPNIAWQWLKEGGAGNQGVPGFGGQPGTNMMGLDPLQGAITGGDNNMLAQILAMLQQQLGQGQG